MVELTDKQAGAICQMLNENDLCSNNCTACIFIGATPPGYDEEELLAILEGEDDE